jgi:hypothetical protein
MVSRVASTILWLAVTTWAQAPGNVQPVVPLRSPFLNPLRAIVQPNAPAAPDSKTGAQRRHPLARP